MSAPLERSSWRNPIRLVLFAVAVGAVAPAQADLVAAPPRYDRRARHDPNGIGKFYQGREIARVMGHQGASWLERPERVAEEAPERLIEALSLRPGMMVADIGAGTGYLSFPMAERVAPDGKVFAVDVQKEMIALLEKRMQRRGISNVVPVLGAEDDPRLAPESVDLIIMVDVYHEFAFPYEMTVAMCRALRPGGRLVFVEYRLEDDRVPIKRVHKMSQKQVLLEMKGHPLRWVGTLDFLPRQHIILFAKEPSAAR